MESFEWLLPPGFPEPWVPEDNPMTDAKVELGRHLFYDPRLSVTGTHSCASCHKQELGFTDGEVKPTGATGHTIPRNSMSLTNVAYYYPYTWSNSLLHTLEEQALVPMFAEAPIELGLTGVIDSVLAGLADAPAYSELIPAAFPELSPEVPFEASHVVRALAAFERTLISGDAPFDRYVYGGDEAALSEDAKRGFELFNSEKFECYHCHTGLNFTSAFRSRDTALLGKDYQNNGLYNLDAKGAYPQESPGLVAITGRAADNGKFRVSTLRNVTKTAPYMHDGSIPTLEAVLEHYAAGGRLITEGAHAGDGRQNFNKSPFVRGFTMDEDEKRAMLAFLESLTDETFLSDPRFSDPWLAQ